MLDTHSTVSEAIERLFLKQFITECRPNVPSCLQNISAKPKAELINKSLIGDLSLFLKEYKSVRERFRKGEMGKTPQFWLLYIDLMRNQFMVHTGVQSNDLDMLICGRKVFLPMYFVMNKVNYARLPHETII